jgi:hypothetical protein
LGPLSDVEEASSETVLRWTLDKFFAANTWRTFCLDSARGALRRTTGLVPDQTRAFRDLPALCMSYDAWIVSFGLSGVLNMIQWVTVPVAYGIWCSIAAIDIDLLSLYFRRRQSVALNATE